MNNAIQTNNNGSIHKTLEFLKLFTHWDFRRHFI